VDAAARVLEDCVANPADDGPRLVWADLVGGERGELVVIQCDLARGGLTPAEVAARRRRERELLVAHGVAWAGALARHARRWRFVRGFVEAACFATMSSEMPIEQRELLATEPLLSAITVEVAPRVSTSFEGVLRIPGLRALQLGHRGRGPSIEQIAALRRIAGSPALRGLRAFGCAQLGSRSVDDVLAVLERTRVEQLWLPWYALEPLELARLLAAVPELTALVLEDAMPQPMPALRDDLLARPLRALRLRALGPHALQALAGARLGATLEHLAFASETDTRGLGRACAQLPRLRTLEVEGRGQRATLDALIGGPCPTLRTLRLHASVDAATLDALAARFGTQLELLDLRGNVAPLADELRARFAGEVRIAYDDRQLDEPPLVHVDVAASFDGGVTCRRPIAPISLVRVDRVHAAGDRAGDVWHFPVPTEDDVLFLGRSVDASVTLQSGTVARRHARIEWRHDHFQIEDVASTNGTLHNGVRVDVATLADGDELVLGEAILRCFIGAGARDHADAAIARLAEEDALTRLPRGRGAARLRLANWRHTVNRQGFMWAQLVMRAAAEQLASELAPGERLTFVEPGCFGITPAAAAARLAAASRPPIEVMGERYEPVLVVDD